MKSTKYDIFLIKIDEIFIFESWDFSPFLTEGEVQKVKKGGKCTLLKSCNSSILSKNMSYFAFFICNFL